MRNLRLGFHKFRPKRFFGQYAHLLGQPLVERQDVRVFVGFYDLALRTEVGEHIMFAAEHATADTILHRHGRSILRSVHEFPHRIAYRFHAAQLDKASPRGNTAHHHGVHADTHRCTPCFLRTAWPVSGFATPFYLLLQGRLHHALRQSQQAAFRTFPQDILHG